MQFKKAEIVNHKNKHQKIEYMHFWNNIIKILYILIENIYSINILYNYQY